MPLCVAGAITSGDKSPASAGLKVGSQMEAKKPYVKPELEELGAIHDVTGGIFDFFKKPGSGPGRGSS